MMLYDHVTTVEASPIFFTSTGSARLSQSTTVLGLPIVNVSFGFEVSPPRLLQMMPVNGFPMLNPPPVAGGVGSQTTSRLPQVVSLDGLPIVGPDGAPSPSPCACDVLREGSHCNDI